MIKKIIRSIFITNEEELGQNSFYLATFFLGSALPISIIFYLISIFISLRTSNKNFFKDRYNLLFLLISGLMIFSNINSTIFNKESYGDVFNIWIYLFNWIPLFLFFSCFKVYLNKPVKRENFAKFLLAGTIPILVSCILQSWFGILGTFKTFFGLIVWYMDKLNYSDISVSGLFSNRNYTAIWLSSILVFAIYQFKFAKIKSLKYTFIVILNFLIIYFTLYTFSRNALIGIFITFLLFFNKLKIVIPIFSFYLLSNLIFSKVPFLNANSPDSIKRFFVLNIENFSNFNRVEIFSTASKLILENPFFGWGGSTFPYTYTMSGGIQSTQHTHNIVLELAYNYGIPLSVILTSLVVFLIFRSSQIIYKDISNRDKLTINKCWLISSIIVIISHLSDITYYDGKISILIWILLSGLRCIIDEDHENLNHNKLLYDD